MSSVPNTLVVIPTYNERDNIAVLIPRVLQLGDNIDILVVDDSSPDNTCEVVQALSSKHPGRVHLLLRQRKEGLGKAYIAGFRWALQRPNYSLICEMDADFSHRPADLFQLIKVAESEADVAVGSRYVQGGQVVNWPIGRLLLSRGASWYVRLTTCLPVQDPTSGFVCWRREVLQALPLERIRFVGYAFQVETKYLAWRLGFRLKEVPIVFEDRMEGSSKMNRAIVWEAVQGVPMLPWLYASGYYNSVQ